MATRRKARSKANRPGSDVQRLELAMRALDEGVYDWDVANGRMHYSQGVYSVLKMPRNMKTAADWRKRIHPEDLAAYDAAIVAHFKKKTRRFECDYRFRATDGTWHWARQRGIAQRDARGRAVRMIGSIGDISELKRAEEARRQSDERYDLAMRAVNEGVYDWNIADGTTYYSDRVSAAMGLTQRELRNAADWHKRIHPEDRPRYDAALVAHFKGKTERFECDVRYRARDGSWRWARQHGIAIRDRDGRAIRMIGSTGNIDELKRAELELHRAHTETAEALERQTATAEILRVISSSPTDLQPTFRAILESTTRLCESNIAALFLYDGQVLSCAAHHNTTPEFAKVLSAMRSPPSRETATRLAALERTVVRVDDYQRDPRFKLLPSYLREESRSLIAVPLLRDDALVGVVTTWRREVRPFADKHVALLQTFADQAVIAIENVRLFNETREALERQTATSEILGVISRSQTDARPVFDAIIRSAVRLCSGTYGSMVRVEGDTMHLWAHYNYTPEALQLVSTRYPAPVAENSLVGLAVRTGEVVHSPDRLGDPRSRETPYTRALGIRAQLTVPLLKDGKAIGTLNVLRKEPGPFSEEQIALLKTFADQAVIAIENVRLFNETKEALERQTATAEILRVISSSPTDIQPVLDAVAERAARLCEAEDVVIRRVDSDGLRNTAHFGSDPVTVEVYGITRGSVGGRAVLECRTVHVHDITSPESRAEYPDAPVLQYGTGHRTMLAVPLVREGAATGIILMRRREARPFGEAQIELLETFADQAVIAIENVRLFNETKEALERQTATAEILKVISSSPTDTQPVFDAIVRSAVRLCGSVFGVLIRFDGKLLHLVAHENFSAETVEMLKQAYPMPPSADQVSGRAILNRAVAEVADAQADPSYRRQMASDAGYRSTVGVPMLRDGVPIGVIVVAWKEPSAYTEKQIALLRTFADQAVIAIENVRLFNETKEALERQTATAEILQVISSSPTDLRPVFDAILDNALRLCAAHMGALGLYDGKHYQSVAQRGGNPEFNRWLRERGPIVPPPDSALGRMTAGRQPVHVADVKDTYRYSEGNAFTRTVVDVGGLRSLIAVPMLKEGTVIGGIAIYRREVQPFTQKQVDLVATFASQAVIAIENVRLFNETKEALERQTATAEILKVIANSPSDTQPVFDAIVESAGRLFAPCDATISMLENGQLHWRAGVTRRTDFDVEKVKALYPLPFDVERSPSSRAIAERRVIEILDAESPDAPDFTRRVGKAGGFRSGVFVPLIREGEGIGTIILTLPQAGFKLTENQRALVQTFADQAVIAIENVRLFNETKEALERQTATAEILKVIASSPSDVQPVFDAIVRSCQRLFSGEVVGLTLVNGGELLPRAFVGAEDLKDLPKSWPLDRDSATGACVLDRRTVSVADTLRVLDKFPRMKDLSIRLGYRSGLYVPLRRESEAIGAIVIVRKRPGAFSEREIALAETFAGQAVIAIENVRLFNETKEALERQTATAEILKVIASSPSDVQPVFEAIARSALTLCGSSAANVYRYDGTQMYFVASNQVAPELVELLYRGYPRPPDRSRATGRAILSKQVVRIEDALADPDYDQSVVTASGWRRMFAVPMLREGEPIGAIALNWPEPGPIPAHQEMLLRTFADQAVIAIENVRLFNETKEALERQTATAEILRVIARSPSNVQPVFDAIVKSCLPLFGGMSVALFLKRGDLIDRVAFSLAAGSKDEARDMFPAKLDGGGVNARAIQTAQLVQVADVMSEAGASERLRTIAQRMGFRSIMAAPLLRDGEAIGTITVFRVEPTAFSAQQAQLLRTFADQAVIAIENVRLFKELQSRTEALTRSVGQLTALGEVGQAISSTLELDTVLQTIVSRAVQLAGLDAGGIYEYDERAEEFRLRTAENMSSEVVELLRNHPIRKGEGAVGTSAVTREPVQIENIEDESYDSRLREILMRAGRRAVLAVPLLREDHIIGALAVQKVAPGPFAPEVVELLKTFATQSAMAIQNARLFREIAEKGRQLEVASRHKSQFLASMSHELRTPLNAILGFNEMLLGEVYGAVPADMKEPLGDIQTSGKHLLRLINNVLDLAKIEAGRMELALTDYSVQDTVGSVHSTLRPLAADKGLEFVATVPADIPLGYGDAGRIAQCLMNLAGNSLKFTRQGRVEISVQQQDGQLRYCVADTGMGIPPDKIGSLFTEFKQTDATIASEYGGTGLGLSITKKFIEMHGGRIWVESEPGKGSSFIFEIPLRAKTG